MKRKGMKVSKYILSLCILLLPSLLLAEVVVLRSGQRVRGEIVLQNEEVVILRSTDGMRYQYPMSQVVAVQQEDGKNEVAERQNDVNGKSKSVLLRAQATGGALYVPAMGWGSYVGADLVIGTYVMGDWVFVGGCIGYRAKIINESVYSFIPLQACMSAVLSDDTKHAPIVGLNVGYGFSTSRKTLGGICMGVDVGWHYMVTEGTSVMLGVNAEWQQAQTDVNQMIIYPETKEEKEFVNRMGLNVITIGLKVAIHF